MVIKQVLIIAFLILLLQKVGSDHLPLISEIAFTRTLEESNSQ